MAGCRGNRLDCFSLWEVLLNFAEAAFELGTPAEALDAVNQIRARAGMPVMPAITRDAIRHERKVELKFELHRYWDLRRYRTAVTELTGDFSSFNLNLDIITGKFKIELIEKIRGIHLLHFTKRTIISRLLQPDSK
jgi:starch-binding outer membrane protein, SusD/RagB family